MEIYTERNLDNLAIEGVGFLVSFCFSLFLGCSAEDALLLGPRLLLYQILGGPWEIHG